MSTKRKLDFILKHSDKASAFRARHVRVNTNIPNWLMAVFAKRFTLGKAGGGVKNKYMWVGLTLILFAAGADISTSKVVSEIVKMFPDPEQRQSIASNLQLVAENLSIGIVPTGEQE